MKKRQHVAHAAGWATWGVQSAHEGAHGCQSNVINCLTDCCLTLGIVQSVMKENLNWDGVAKKWTGVASIRTEDFSNGTGVVLVETKAARKGIEVSSQRMRTAKKITWVVPIRDGVVSNRNATFSYGNGIVPAHALVFPAQTVTFPNRHEKHSLTVNKHLPSEWI